ncbi:MAG: hypothetical protein KDC12_00850 [Flavobacteriales bacterium]|nr:hypothetical protein [Flavobacteriales bacterium]
MNIWKTYGCWFAMVLLSVSGSAGSHVEVIQTETGYQLLYNGEPYFVKGAGGTVEMDVLKNYGGNSIRTWGVMDNTDEILDEALRHGLTVTFGIWMGQERQGFDYSNKGAIEAQVEYFRSIVRKYKDHPAILVWGVGNEVDLDYTNFDVWMYLEELCKMIKEEDPNHPTMTVTAGLDVAEVKLIQKFVPSVDILGVNTYGDISYLPEAMRSYGWTKPYMVTEWGPYGWWEVERTNWGASIEQTSTSKAETYDVSMKAILSDPQNCLGSYVFLWGQKQEHTSTWFGLFTEDGQETGAMDVLCKAWTGELPENTAPRMTVFSLDGKSAYDNITVKSGQSMIGNARVMDDQDDTIVYTWQVIPESTDKKTGGDAERAPKPVKGVFSRDSKLKDSVSFVVQEPGQYRLFLFASDGKGKVATGNIPFKVVE